VRTLLLILLPAAAAFGIWQYFDDGAPDQSRQDGERGVEREAPGDAHAYARGSIRYGTLMVTVQTPDGGIPEGIEVGYFEPFRDNPRLVYADRNGKRTFTDAPLGKIDVIAQAPGYKRAKRACILQAGITESVKLFLEPGDSDLDAKLPPDGG